MKILSAKQTQAVDAYTIEHEPIASIDLMERASEAFVGWLVETFPDETVPITIFCGPGNNGGDGLAAARLLHERAYNVTVYLCVVSDRVSEDHQINLDRLRAKRVVPIHRLEKDAEVPTLPLKSICVDALFGSGLSRPITGYWAELLTRLNQQPVTRVAIDIPSGLFADEHSEGTTFQADYTLAFQLPKLAFFLSENAGAVGTWVVRPIGLSAEGIGQQPSPYHYLEEKMVGAVLHRRGRFDHKGTFGHALIVAGSYGKMGACVLCSRAALRAGAGLVTVHAPRCGYEILQIAFPEAMVVVDDHRFVFSEVSELDHYDAVGLGPGLGTNEVTVQAVHTLLESCRRPLVIDADGLNILARNQQLLSAVPPNSILTPHPKEFERLFGKTEHDFDRLDRLRERARQHRLYIVLKGGYTAIATPEGDVYFNGTGNPGMGTAGTGDVLTGILTGLLAQGYSPLQTCQLGVYLHGLAGDLAAAELEQESLIAEDVISYLGKAFKQLRQGQVRS